MQKRKSPLYPILLAALAAVNLHAATPVWDTANGIDPIIGGTITAGSGTWNFNTAANWSLDGGVTRVPWTSNSDTASFQFSGIGATVTTSGAVGAAGLIFSGSNGGNNWTIAGTGFTLGAGGITSTIADNNGAVISAPIFLTSSQTWQNSGVRNINNGATVSVTGVISSASGTTNLTFDGNSRTNSSAILNANPRTTFNLSGANTFTGTTTVTGGAQLVLTYATGVSTSRLDDNSALILAGGTIAMNGGGNGNNIVERVGSTTINAGHSNVITGSSGGGGTANHLDLGLITHNAGGTFDVNGADLARTSTALDSTGLLGGWATSGGTRFATVSSVSNPNNAISALQYSSSNNTYSTFTDANVSVTGAVTNATNVANQSVNSIRLAGSINIGAGNTLTVTSGGIIGDINAGVPNGGISNGNLTSGLASGELFVHTPTDTVISSAIVNNGATPTHLVKAGLNQLTISGANTYTGSTYINAGTLLVNGSATVRGTVVQQGGTTLTIGSGGTLSPGAAGATGAMTLNGNLSLNTGSILDFQLGTASDLLSLTNTFGTLTGSAAAGGITLNLSDAGGMAAGQTYSLVQWASGMTLSSFDLTDFTVANTSGFGGNLVFNGNSLDFVTTAVPEPSTAALALGGLGLGALLRRRAVSAQ